MARTRTPAQVRDDACREMREILSEICHTPARDWATMDDAIQSLIMARNMLKAARKSIEEANNG